jgi:peptidoglycan/LPS O-acetylase OafA/YrhL
MRYRAEIDGLRAVALLPVILFHAGFEIFSGGFVGVDVFFVISGYLITAIILFELDEGKFSVINFYERRARRILPALFVVMFACLPFAWLWMLPREMKNFSQSLVAVSVFASNVLFWRTDNYFETAVELKPLLHTWSLAVEEQYYLFFPVFLMLTWRLGKRWILAMLAVVAVISLAVAQWGSVAIPALTFYLLPTRGWELLIGAFVAFYFSNGVNQNLSKSVSQVGSAIGLLLLIYAIFAFDKQTPFPSLYTLIPTIGTALICLCATQQTLVGKLLGSKPFVGIGLISYSAYLWHQPLFAFARHRSLYEPSKLLLCALVVAAFVLAYFSWKYVESSFRNKQRFSRKQIFIYGAVGSAFFVVLGLVGHFNKGYPSRMPQSTEIPEIEMSMIDNGWCFYSIDSIDSLTFGAKGLECWLGDKSSNKKGILFGDSFAAHYDPLWNSVGLESKVAINTITTNWCFPSINDEFPGTPSSRALQQCLYNRKYLIDNISKYDFAIFSGEWNKILKKNMMGGVLKLIDYAASKTKLVVLMPTPKQFDSDVVALYKKSLLHDAPFDIKRVSTRKDEAAVDANRLLEEVANRYVNVLYVDRDSLFNIEDSPSDLTKDGIPFSFDGEHISIYGSKHTVDSFLRSKKYKEFEGYLR